MDALNLIGTPDMTDSNTDNATPARGCGDPECGCATPTFTRPLEALGFLSARFKFAGVSEGVALAYARDIDAILERELASEENAGGAKAGGDTRRLDFLIAHGLVVRRMKDTGLFMVITDSGDPVTGAEFESAREAIDDLIESGISRNWVRQ